MPRSYAWRTRLVNASCPSSRCTRPPNVPVPRASRVTFTLLLPRVTQSVASLFVGWAPSRERAAAPKVAARKSRRVDRDIILTPWETLYHVGGPPGPVAADRGKSDQLSPPPKYILCGTLGRTAIGRLCKRFTQRKHHRPRTRSWERSST